MKKNTLLVMLLFAILAVAGLWGCGSGREDDGSIEMKLTSTDSGSDVRVVADISYMSMDIANPNGRGEKMTFSTHIYNLSGTISWTDSEAKEIDATASNLSRAIDVPKSTEILYLDATASIRGVSTKNRTQIPASSIRMSPPGAEFPFNAPAGDSIQLKNVSSVAESKLPTQYDAIINVEAAAYIDVSVSAVSDPPKDKLIVTTTTITLTLKNNSGTTPASALLSVYDDTGNRVVVPVRYFK